MLKTTVLLLGSLALVWSQTTPVNQCIYHNAPLPINTYIEDCGSPPCQLHQLRDLVIHLIFRAPYAIQSMRTVATGYIFGPISIPYDLGEQSNTCNYLTNTPCPVAENQVITYTLKTFIEPFFPVGASVTVEFRINDDNAVPIMCIRVPITIIPPVALSSSSSSAVRLPAPTNATAPLIVKLNAL